MPMRLYATFSHNGSEQYLNLLLIGSTTNWHLPGVCLSIAFTTPFLGEGVFGASRTDIIPHLGALSLGYFSCSRVGGVCACWYVCLCGPLLEHSPWPSASVCLLNGWVPGGCKRFLSPVSTELLSTLLISLSLFHFFII